jgi:small-conductance mechanosensitive channel
MPTLPFLPLARAAVRGLLALCAAFLATLASAQEAAAPAPQPTAAPAAASTAAPAAEEARVSIFNRPIATFRAPFLGMAPAERARRTQGVLLELLGRGGPGVVTAQAQPQGSVLLIDGELALILTPPDADAVRGETLEGATRKAQAALARVIAETREARDRGRLLRALGLALAATALYAAALWLTWRLRHWLRARIAVLLEGAATRARITGTHLWEATRMHALSQWLVRVLSWVLMALFTYEWLVYCLKQFPRTRAAGEQLGAFLVGVFERIGGGILHALPDLAVAVVIFLLARALVGALHPLFDRLEQDGGEGGAFGGELARPTRRIVSVGIWLFAIVMAYPYLPGADSEAFKGMSVLVGLMITLGGSSIVGQAASGLILMYSKTLRVGEHVRINEQEGTVAEIGTFTTRIRTGAGQQVTMPNAVVIGSVTVNYSRDVPGSGFILDTTLTIGYDTPWRQVEALLLEAANRTEGVLPGARVLQRALADFYVEYRLVCLVSPPGPVGRAVMLHRLHCHVLDVFNEHGVQIMSPHYEADPEGAKLVAPGHPFAARPRAAAGPRADAPPAAAEPAA